MNMILLNKIPKKYHRVIKDIYIDEDGIWVHIDLNSGYILKKYYADYTIHEDNMKDILNVIKTCLTKKITIN